MVSNLKTQQHTKGFALLMTLIVVSVLISIGLVVVDLTLKQVRLSTNAKDSESAFHAANAGVECARYWRRVASSSMESGADISPTCFSSSLFTNTKVNILSNTNGGVYLYSYGYTWNNNQRCSIMYTLVMNAAGTGSGLTINPTQYIPGYPVTSKTCAAGEQCTILASHGFNKPCSDSGGYGSVEREVLLQF